MISLLDSTGEKGDAENLVSAFRAEILNLGKDILALQKRMAALESTVSVIDRVARSKDDAFVENYPDRFSIAASHASLGSPSFYALEHSLEGVPLRWTGPELEFSFAFFLDRSRKGLFQLEFERVYFSEPLEEIKIFVDGLPCLAVIGPSGKSYLATGEMPVREDKGGSIVAFVCPSVRSPSENGSSDKRRLGLRFRSFSAHALAATV